MQIARLLALLGMLQACGDDGGGGSTSAPRIATGIDPGTPVGDLSDAQAQRLCDEVANAALDVLTHPRILGGFCTLEGILFALLAAPAEREQVCTEFVESCSNPAGFPDIAVVGANCGQPSATCDATVGEIETCVNAALAALEVFYLDISCSGLAQIQIAPVLPLPPTNCQAVQARCPNLYPTPAATPTGPSAP